MSHLRALASPGLAIGSHRQPAVPHLLAHPSAVLAADRDLHDIWRPKHTEMLTNAPAAGPPRSVRQGESGRPQTGPSLAVRPPPQRPTTSPERVLLLHLVRELTKLQVGHPTMAQSHLRCSAQHGWVQGTAKEVLHVLPASGVHALAGKVECCGAPGMVCMLIRRPSWDSPSAGFNTLGQCLSAVLQAPQPLDPDRVQSTLELAGLIVICSAPEPGKDSAPVTAVTMLVSLQQMLQALQMLHAARQALEYFQGECWGSRLLACGVRVHSHRRTRSGCGKP